MKLDNTKLGKRIKVIRKQKNISQMALSEIIDCSPNHLSYIENGNRSISLANFVRLANALGVSADELYLSQQTAANMKSEYSSVSSLPLKRRRVRIKVCYMLIARPKSPYSGTPFPSRTSGKPSAR